MTASEFVRRVKQLAPSVDEMKRIGLDSELIDLVDQIFRIDRRTERNVDLKNPILELIENYDLSKFEARAIRFKDRPVIENDNTIFASDGINDLMIDNKTGVIMLRDLENQTVLSCATSANSFLNALLVLMEYQALISMKDCRKDLSIKSKYASMATSAAGGDEYLKYYETLVR